MDGSQAVPLCYHVVIFMSIHVKKVLRFAQMSGKFYLFCLCFYLMRRVNHTIPAGGGCRSGRRDRGTRCSLRPGKRRACPSAVQSGRTMAMTGSTRMLNLQQPFNIADSYSLFFNTSAGVIRFSFRTSAVFTTKYTAITPAKISAYRYHGKARFMPTEVLAIIHG